MSGNKDKCYLNPPRQSGYLGQTIRTLAFHDVELVRCSYKDPMTGAWKGRWVESKFPAYSVWTKGLEGWRHYIQRTIDGTCVTGDVTPVRVKTAGDKNKKKKHKTQARESGGSQVHQDRKPKRLVMRRKGKILELPAK